MTTTISLLAGYVIAVSMFYLMGYWTEFGINYLEYITLSEIAIISLDSIFSAFGLTAFGGLLSYIYLGNLFRVGAGRNTPEGKFALKWWKAALAPFVIAIFYSIYIGSPLAMFLIALIFSPIVGLWVANQGFLTEFINNDEIRFLLINMAVLVLFMSYPKGFLDAYSLKNGGSENQVVVAGEQYTYLGKLNTSVFLYKKESNSVLQLTKMPQKIQYLSTQSKNGKSKD
ncbi:hypothetical protein [Salinivibrio proteolyticus]|uniref:Uncharacterized protein n=1 Tax=Salinivibrio proteolyticus TaxID=334715 RepID=A0ABY7L9D5_9GAMM|nr:hypothetical protein [Salinivibrio proteolyticus]WBA13864.1 hypothetical protein N7E60_08990 [Salinivibrio proteolyticus]